MTFLKDTNSGNLLKEIRANSPLIWNISNFVSMDIAANILLSIGASPAMAHAIEEANSFANNRQCMERSFGRGGCPSSRNRFKELCKQEP